MRVGILTFHEIFNPGAYLQAMGTVELLKSMGHEPVIIDYTSPAHRYSSGRLLSNPRNWRHPRALLETVGRHRAFQKAQVYFNKTKRLLTHSDIGNEPFDAVVIGADIVWDYLNPHLGNDPVYFGAHLNAEKVISFAASCGPVPLDEVPPKYVQDGLKTFSSFAVRDENTKDFVEKYAGRAASVICDPAFHLDVDAFDPNPAREPYLLVYAMPHCLTEDFVAQIKEYAVQRGLRMIAVCYRQNWVDENVIGIGPTQWLAYIRGATAVATNTFHGTIFSTKAGVPYVTEMNDAIRLKTVSMIDRLGLENQIFSASRPVQIILDEPWNVAGVHHRIEAWQLEARGFLEGALSKSI